MKIKLSLLLTTPYHSAPISSQPLVVTDEGRIAPKNGGAKGSPLTPTYKEPKYIAAMGLVEYFPVVRSLQICKQLRTRLNKDIIQSFKARGLSIAKASTYAGMEVGAASGKPAQMSATLDQSVQALYTPIALFGGGSFSLPSTIQVSDANVFHESLSSEGLNVIPEHIDPAFALSIEPYSLTFAAPITRQDPVSDIKDASHLSNLEVIENHKEQITAWQSAVQNAQSSRKANAEEKKSDLRNMVAYEAVLPGITFTSELTIHENAGSAVKGAVISILNDMIENGITIGGRTSRGNGKMAVQASVDGDLLELDKYMLDIEAYSEWLEQVTPNDLAAFFEA